MDCSLPGSSVYDILQARILEWVAIPFLLQGIFPRIEPWSPALQVDSLPFEPPGKPKGRLHNYKKVTSASQSVSSVAQSCLTLCNPMDCSTPGFPVHHQLPELAQTHAHGVDDAIQPSHPLPPPSSPAFNLYQHQGLFQ